MGDAEPVKVNMVGEIGAVAAADWDACAGPRHSQGARALPYNPFISHTFLSILEESGSVSRETGWMPHHLVAEDGAGGVAACMPCYLKSHSHGEYVFDWGWADAFERAGGRYYPKLQASVPFTPVPGRRLLVRPDLDARHFGAVLAEAAEELARRYGVSSVHVTFLNKPEWELLGSRGFLQRTGQQFHWTNAGYGDFDDFLAALSARKRKQIRRERRDARAGGISIEWLTGGDITEAHWDAFFAFYMDTGSRKWGRPYLNRRFFSLLGETMADDVLLVFANRAGRPIAGALNMIGSDALYGRYWGALEDQPFLHFEVCYYQAIEFAIARGLERVEAGAQGPHKLARGYLPQTVYSAHWIADPGLRRAVARFLEEERAHVDFEQRLLTEHAPFRKDGPLDRPGET
ncbi:MAG TPA: GNAT family N-acetyltransferase [Hyphomicrobiales bacterium]|nr:GNAT family N-acetyltransferase [Hyphomicrobiales bacterium]